MLFTANAYGKEHRRYKNHVYVSQATMFPITFDLANVGPFGGFLGYSRHLDDFTIGVFGGWFMPRGLTIAALGAWNFWKKNRVKLNLGSKLYVSSPDDMLSVNGTPYLSAQLSHGRWYGSLGLEYPVVTLTEDRNKTPEKDRFTKAILAISLGYCF